MAIVEEKTAGLREFEALRDNEQARGRLSSRGIYHFLLASRDGLLIDAVTASDRAVETDTLAAYAAATLDISRTRGEALQLGAVRGIVVEYEDGQTIVVDPVAEESLAVFVGEVRGSLDQLARELPHLAAAAVKAQAFIHPEAPAVADGPAVPAAPALEPAPARAEAAAAVAPAPAVATMAPAAPAKARAPKPREHAKRVVLRKALLETAGFTATASVELVLGDQHVVGKAVGRNIPEQALALAAEATVRAVTEFLPTGYGVVLENIQAVSSPTEVAVWANVIFITPTEEQLLPGIARLQGDPPTAAAKTVLAAINRRLELALND